MQCDEKWLETNMERLGSSTLIWICDVTAVYKFGLITK